MARFYLRFGSAVHAVLYNQGAPTTIKSYQVDSAEKYPIKLIVGSGEEDIGLGSVGGTEGAFWVEPDVEIKFPHEDVTFYAAWTVGEDGAARLSEVLAAVKG
jgi:hypothetical protein